MSYVDERYAVISLGCSCQTAAQIDANIPAIGAALGTAQGRRAAAFFDWLIAPSGSAVRLLNDGLPAPSAAEAIGVARGRPQYLAYGALFYHEFLRSDGGYLVDPESAALVGQKFSYLARKTLGLARDRDPIFVWSNTQANLDQVGQECDDLDLILTDEAIERIVDAADRWSGRSAHYLFVSSPDRCTVRRRHPRVEVRQMPIDPSNWYGDAADWRRALGSALPRLSEATPLSA